MTADAGSPPTAFRNEILNALPPGELERLVPQLTRVRLANGQGLHEPGEPIDHVFFIERGFASVVARVDDGAGGVEVGLMGRESMTGLSAAFDAEAATFNRVMVQSPGEAYRMPAQALREHTDSTTVLRRRLFRASDGLMAQVSQTAACNSRHALPQRLARWLLLAHDRTDGDELGLTHVFLSMMLTVRRPGVTVAMGTLKAAGLVGHDRGRVLIRDRAGLEAAACDCYGRIRAFIARLAASDFLRTDDTTTYAPGLNTGLPT